MSGCSDLDDSESDQEDWGQTLLDDKPPTNIVQGTQLKPLTTPGPGRPTTCPHTRVIVHIDIDCFYAQVEMVRNPSLRDKPLGIQQKNIIVTCNYVARARGLTKLMYLKEAQEKCPDLVIVKGEDLTNYRHMSYKVTELFLKYSPLVERLGMDENYVDVTNMVASDEWCHLAAKSDYPGYQYGTEDSSEKGIQCSCEWRLRIGAHISKFLRDKLFTEYGLTSCGGVAHNKLLAKLVGSTHKPNKQTWLPAQHAAKLLLSLGECRKIPSIGRSTATKLASLGITSISDLQTASPADLEAELGPRTAQLVCDLSLGIDESEVTVTGRPQTMSDEDSFGKCCDLKDARRRTEDLIRSLLVRVYEDGRVPQTVRLTVRNTAYHRISRQCAIPTTVTTKIRQGDTEGAVTGLLQVCMDLLCKLVDVKAHFHLTLINVAVCKLIDHSARGISAFLTRTPAATREQSQDGGSDSKTAAAHDNQKDTASLGIDMDSFKHQKSLSSCDTGSENNLTAANKCGSTKIDLPSNTREHNSDKRNVNVGITGRTEDEVIACHSVVEQAKGGTKRSLEELGDKLEGTAPKRSFFKEAQLSSQRANFLNTQGTPFKSERTENEPGSSQASCLENVQSRVGPERPPGEVNVKQTEAPPGGVSEGGVLVPPPGVDPGVFYSLPKDLQLDVVNQYKDNNLQRTGPHTDKNNQTANRNITGSPKPSQTLGRKQSQTASTSKKSIKSFFDKNNSIETKTTDSLNMRNLEKVCNSSPESHSKQASPSLIKPEGNHDNQVKTPEAPSGCVEIDIPDDMDKDVFLSLPPDIQQELRADWRRRLACKPGTNATGGATSSGRKQTMGRKSGSHGQGSLERFLKKK